MKFAVSTWIVLGTLAIGAVTRPLVAAPPPPPPRWILGTNLTTVWPVSTDVHLPHGDFIEQGGLRCGFDLPNSRHWLCRWY
jgi:hypothetical protein